MTYLYNTNNHGHTSKGDEIGAGVNKKEFPGCLFVKHAVKEGREQKDQPDKQSQEKTAKESVHPGKVL